LRSHDLTVLEPFITSFFDSLTEVWNTRSHAIVEEIVDGFYPSPLANERLRAATATWLDENPDAAPALRRMIIEHLAGVERALVAQAADAKA
jgi:aminopeptidase N